MTENVPTLDPEVARLLNDVASIDGWQLVVNDRANPADPEYDRPEFRITNTETPGQEHITVFPHQDYDTGEVLGFIVYARLRGDAPNRLYDAGGDYYDHAETIGETDEEWADARFDTFEAAVDAAIDALKGFAPKHTLPA